MFAQWEDNSYRAVFLLVSSYLAVLIACHFVCLSLLCVFVDLYVAIDLIQQTTTKIYLCKSRNHCLLCWWCKTMCNTKELYLANYFVAHKIPNLFTTVCYNYKLRLWTLIHALIWKESAFRSYTFKILLKTCMYVILTNWTILLNHAGITILGVICSAVYWTNNFFRINVLIHE